MLNIPINKSLETVIKNYWLMWKIKDLLPILIYPVKGLRLHFRDEDFLPENLDRTKLALKFARDIRPSTQTHILWSLPYKTTFAYETLKKLAGYEPYGVQWNEPVNEAGSENEALSGFRRTPKRIFICAYPNYYRWNAIRYTDETPVGKDSHVYISINDSLHWTHEMFLSKLNRELGGQQICTEAGLTFKSFTGAWGVIDWWTPDRIKQLRSVWEQCFQTFGDFCHHPLIGGQTLNGSSWALFSIKEDGTNPRVHPALYQIVQG